MVVKMRLPLLWSPLISKKFQVKVVVLRLHALHLNHDHPSLLTVELFWKGPKSALRSLRKTTKRNYTKHAAVVLVPEEHDVDDEDDGDKHRSFLGEVEWNEEYNIDCTLTSNAKDCAVFHPWEIFFSIRDGSNTGQKNDPVVGTALLNLAEFVSNKEREIQVPVSLEDNTAGKPPPSLHLALTFLELRTAQEPAGMTQKKIVPALSPPNPRNTASTEKDEVSALRARLRILRDFVSAAKSKKTCHEDEGSDGRLSLRSDDADYTYPFDTDSVDDDPEKEELEDGKEKSNFRKSFSYGSLASANYFGGSFYSEIKINGEFEDWVYYSHRRSDVGNAHPEEITASASDLSLPSKRSILPWKRKRLGFKSPKPKGEPLLKPYGEDGGDDIDFDRRQMSSSDESLGLHKMDNDVVANRSSISDFGDDNFVIGSWEAKEVVSRDGHMKLCSQVFFAFIDQRSERAAGESACAVLVAVIADWFQNNLAMMPVKSQFDSLIREGSLEWRKLCENETYQERFPDKHFDLETVLQAKIRPLSVIQSKSFIGFFHPEGVADDNNGFEFLHGAMSFDSIWDEIEKAALRCPVDGTSQLYIVSWNDHFFILMVESHAYYIVDTLGERLYEGCNQAYILKFDENTSIQTMPPEKKPATGEMAEAGKEQGAQKSKDSSEEVAGCKEDDDENGKKEEFLCQGKESCKEYIKNFLAAIPIRELQDDMKKGLMSSAPIHHRLQIEFNYTQLSRETEMITELANENGVFIQETQ